MLEMMSAWSKNIFEKLNEINFILFPCPQMVSSNKDLSKDKPAVGSALSILDNFHNVIFYAW